MKTLVTGGAGFIGSHIQDALFTAGHEVAIVDNLRSGFKTNLHEKATFYEVDICDKEKLASVMADYRPEAIFHLAAQNEVPYSMDHPFEDQQMNIVGIMNLLDAAKDVGVKKVVYSNTGGAYYGEVPFEKLPISEDEPVRKPTSFYGVSKAAAEQYLKLYGTLYGIQWVSLRYSNVYGPRQAGNREAGIIAIFTDKFLKNEQPHINGQGQHSRDYVYVGDVVRANIKALAYPENEYFNIATGIETSNLEVFNYLKEATQSSLAPQFGDDRPGDVLRNSLSPEKAEKLLGWEPEVLIQDGIKKTVAYYQHEK